jgi:hypothetical protein
MMTYSEELAAAQKHLALALTFTDNNPLKATVINSAKASIAHCERKLAESARRSAAHAAHAASVAAYNALPFFKRLFARNPSR